MTKCRITVLQRTFNKELVERYCSLALEPGYDGCDWFQVGQVFEVEDYNRMPEGFCAWAWADIQKDVIAILSGGSFPWMKQERVNITCCTDGLMPAVFLVEAVDEA